MGVTMPARTATALSRLVGSSLGAEDFQLEAVRCLRQAIPFEGWCWATLDPDSTVPISALGENSPLADLQRRHSESEWGPEPDFNKLTQLMAGPRRAAALCVTTGGQPGRSRRWCEMLRPLGFGDEMRGAMVADGNCWGSLTLYREKASRRFTEDDEDYLAFLLSGLAARTRASIPERRQPDPLSMGPGVVTLDADLVPLASTREAERWLAGFSRWRGKEPLPSVFYAVIARLRAGLPAHTRARTADGRWVRVQVSELFGPPAAGSLAVTIQPASPAELAPLLMSAARLTPREQQVCRYVLEGCSSADIARALQLSGHTVRDHLSAIFGKVGVRSRRQLMAALLGSDRQTPARRGTTAYRDFPGG
ncbi:MAG: hypothetical protein J2P45_14535 [Candidatus Dormibacteraeota bacterium]|nr:hypothetical protein [Candidatus Dormibacteraeota bacterium]